MKTLATTAILALWLPAGATNRYPELSNAVQRLSSRIAKLEAKVEALEKRLPGGEIREYRVDTAAGTIRCEVCRFEEK